MESSANTHPAAATLSYPASPTSGRPSGRTCLPPWTQIVRGPESESSRATTDISLPSENHPPESFENSGNGNAGSKKPAWNKKPANGSVVDTGPVVMGGAASWPALSESTKASTKPSSSDYSKNLVDSGSTQAPVPALQVTGLASSLSSSLSPLPSPSQSSLAVSQKPTTSNANVNQFSSSNHGRPARQRSIKRDGGGNTHANGGFSHQSLPHGEGLSNNHNNFVKPSFSSGNESSGRDNSQNQGNRESSLRNAAGGDHHQPRNSFRRQNSGPHSRGDGTHHNYGGRRDQDRGNHDWNNQRNFNGRDVPAMQSRGAGPRGFVRTPPVSAPFVHPGVHAPMRPFINPMGMPDMPMIYFSPGMPFVAPVHPPMFFPAPDPQLLVKIVNQIDYYFSNENLIKDTFLRRNMDQNGWVPVSLIAGFKKVKQLTDNVQLILEALRSSTVIETQGDNIRRRNDWMRWIMPPTMQFSSSTSSLQLPETNVATLSRGIQSVSLNERGTTTDPKSEELSRSSSEHLNSTLSNF